jgi:hypothetical protein
VCEGGVALPYASPSFWAADDSSEHRAFYECLSEHACPGGQYDAQAQAVTARSQCAQGERKALQTALRLRRPGDVVMLVADVCVLQAAPARCALGARRATAGPSWEVAPSVNSSTEPTWWLRCSSSA